jgi:hypothetical protein
MNIRRKRFDRRTNVDFSTMCARLSWRLSSATKFVHAA